MAEYIEREALIADIDAAMDHAGLGYVIGQTMKRYIKRQPAAEVAPVVHAHSVVNWLGDCHCSNCGDYIDGTKPYCAKCGAWLDEPETRED